MTLAPNGSPEPAAGRAHERPRPTSAQFWRCALQVNPVSYNGTYRGQRHGYDEDSYNRALADQCEALGIQVIGIADHGSVDAVDELRAVLSARGVVVFPGFEIASTEKVHMVCLFPETTTKDQLNRYLGKLDLTDVQDGVRPSGLGCLEIARCVRELGGIWYAAHLTSKNGLLRLGMGDGGALTHIWTDCDLVRVAQIPGRVEDVPPEYQKIVRNQVPEYYRDRPIVLINAKDVATPEGLADPGASTWIKMTEPTFESLKVAFLDPESRIRLEIEGASHSALLGLRIQGGYLDGLEVRFSDNLNALIGGRGVGKSTLVECIRYALDLPPKGDEAQKTHLRIVKANLGNSSGTVEVRVRAASYDRAEFVVSRRFGEPPIVRNASGGVSQLEPRDLLPAVEIYGQNEIYELARDDSNHGRLLERFLQSDGRGDDRRKALRQRLADNAAKLIKAESERDGLAQTIGRLPKLREQLEIFRNLGVEAKLDKIRLFEREKQLVARADEELLGLQRGVQAVLHALPDLVFLSDSAIQGLPNTAHLVKLRSALEVLCADVARRGGELEQAVRVGNESVQAVRTAWQEALEVGERDLETAVADLPDLAGKRGREVGTAFRQLTQELERIQPLQVREASYGKLVESLRAERQELIAELSALRSQRSSELGTAVTQINRRLKGKLRVAVVPEGKRSVLREFLLECRLEGLGERRLSWIDESGEVTPLSLARAIAAGAEELERAFRLTPGVAQALSKLPRSKLLELESLELADRIQIELNVAHSGAEQFRPLDQLSIGQQCTAILHLLLLDNLDPLIVDQPEDNLDNAFIAERIVRQLRASKAKRQFLFSTHNANIPVFGDAEWIGVLSATDGRAELPLRLQGSIDVPEIRARAAEILEGGQSAFNQRKEMYGF